jgi:hydrogenase-1 operon protein HyaE
MNNLYSNPTQEKLDQLFERLVTQHNCVLLDAENFNAFIQPAGESLILFSEDPQRVPEAWDLAIILPELLSALPHPPRAGLLPPAAARTLAVRYGIQLWPALLALRGGAYLGVIEGLKDWSVYATQLPQLLAATESRPPSIGIAIQAVGAATTCH